MKKKCMILLVIFIILFSNKVKGSSYTLSISHEDNYFFSISGNGVYMSNRFPYYYIDGEVAYCIEPGKQITTWGYLEDANLPFSEEIIKKLELISRYGYLYPGHNTNLYHMATQMLMWYLTTDKAVDLRDQQYGYGNLIDQLYKKIARPNVVDPIFLTEHPISLSPLARANDDNPEITDRFQLVINGAEIINAYSELVDPIEQERRLLEQAKLKANGDEEAMPMDYDYIDAMEYGMPPISGWGMGIDRIVQLLTSSDNIKDVVMFPLMKPIYEEEDK